jgi:N-acetylglucosaminyl-diphospho-decaprenol L-rhamnosyltransferase
MSRPVIAAIPNYNMGSALEQLLPAIAQAPQGYDEIVVLDDGSHDHSRDVVSAFGYAQLHVGSENKGAAANRNRLQQFQADHSKRWGDAIIHFIDADMRPTSPDNAQQARDIFTRAPSLGMVGGLFTDVAGRQHIYNYGPRYALRNDLGAITQFVVGTQLEKHPSRAAKLWQLLGSSILKDWPNPTEPPSARNTYWCAEGNLLVPFDLFSKLGGFDESLRSHEIQDFSLRLGASHTRRFEPSVAMTHTALQVRDGHRGSEDRHGELYLIRRHGLGRFLTNSESRLAL